MGTSRVQFGHAMPCFTTQRLALILVHIVNNASIFNDKIKSIIWFIITQVHVNSQTFDARLLTLHFAQ